MINKRYVLFKKVARGGMAEIFLGKLIGEDGFERICCFKRILPHYAVEKEFIEMFRDEAHIGKRLQHANVVRVEGFEEVDGAYAIVMEFINGADLRSVIASSQNQKVTIPIPFAVLVIAEAARGLHYAHTKKDDITNRPLGIVHRDISPQNLLLSFDGEVKVTDFGIADADSKLTETKTGIVKGKFSYMSPEQISAQAVDARTDVFALAIILWEMVTQRKLFHSENEIEVIQMVRECAIPANMREMNPEIDEDLEKIILKGLKKNASERYETAAQFEKELRLYISQHYAGYSSDDLAEFLRNLLSERRQALADDIKELLSNKEISSAPALDIDLRQTTNANRRTPGSTNLNKTTFTSSDASRIRSTGSMTGVSSSPGKSGGASQIEKIPTLPTRLHDVGTGTRRTLSSNTSHRPIETDSSATTNIVVGIIAALVLIGLGIYYFKGSNTDKKLPLTVDWTLTTVPEVTKIEIDGEPFRRGKFVKSPIALKALSPGVLHKIQASRPGFQSDGLYLDLTNGQTNGESRLILKQVDTMAPLQISLKYAVPPVHFSLDDGLVDENLSFESPMNLNHITFGKEHLLIVDLSDRSSFSCQFTPRAQSWNAPFLVVIDTSLKKCSYPLR